MRGQASPHLSVGLMKPLLLAGGAWQGAWVLAGLRGSDPALEAGHGWWEAPACPHWLRASVLQVGCPVKVRELGAGTPAQQSPCPARDLQAAPGMDRQVAHGSPGLASMPRWSRGAAASKEVKQAVGVLTGALAWTQSLGLATSAWPAGGGWKPHGDWNFPSHVTQNLLGSCMCVAGTPRAKWAREPLPLPGLWEPDGHTWLPGGRAW